MIDLKARKREMEIVSGVYNLGKIIYTDSIKLKYSSQVGEKDEKST